MHECAMVCGHPMFVFIGLSSSFDKNYAWLYGVACKGFNVCFFGVWWGFALEEENPLNHAT